MPGQEFILVEGIFTANSDGLTCIISKISEESKVSEPPKALENNTNSKASAMAIENLTGQYLSLSQGQMKYNKAHCLELGVGYCLYLQPLDWSCINNPYQGHYHVV